MTAAELIAAGGHLLLGLGIIAGLLAMIVWAFMWLAFLSDSSGSTWSRRELAFLIGPLAVPLLYFAYLFGGGR